MQLARTQCLLRPRVAASGNSFLFHNAGDGKFRDVSVAAGLRIPGKHSGLSAVAADFDDDCWPGLYVACDSTPSLLLHNQRNGTFRESAVAAGVAYGENNEEQGGMGVAVFDTNNDGRPDIIRTNFIDETTSLYRNRGELFRRRDRRRWSGPQHQKHKLGCAGRGLRSGWTPRPSYRQQPHLSGELGKDFPQSPTVYWNVGNVAFADVSAGDAILNPRESRGLAAGDLDGDGAPELLVVNQNEAPLVLKNQTPGRSHGILFHLAGTRSNHSAIGAKVSLDGRIAEVQSGGSYLSQSDLRLHFGLGTKPVIESIDIRWPFGTSQKLTCLPVDQVLKITEPTR